MKILRLLGLDRAKTNVAIVPALPPRQSTTMLLRLERHIERDIMLSLHLSRLAFGAAEVCSLLLSAGKETTDLYS